MNYYELWYPLHKITVFENNEFPVISSFHICINRKHVKNVPEKSFWKFKINVVIIINNLYSAISLPYMQAHGSLCRKKSHGICGMCRKFNMCMPMSSFGRNSTETSCSDCLEKKCFDLLDLTLGNTVTNLTFLTGSYQKDCYILFWKLLTTQVQEHPVQKSRRKFEGRGNQTCRKLDTFVASTLPSTFVHNWPELVVAKLTTMFGS